ncbi:hypothetical protein EXIGLDRAFT_717591 [Exidia glandulosa HHB12029]|uniref:Uncharacterized protein n=1 Tax=Exidia glandulosa HHB12029 TaxID=1314781 RepID=A0A165I8H4_EXIGL|nr:hypothetical protein EXIGLDRAFT_717591 [Exidia glandulosa HHB12029]
MRCSQALHVQTYSEPSGLELCDAFERSVPRCRQCHYLSTMRLTFLSSRNYCRTGHLASLCNLELYVPACDT